MLQKLIRVVLTANVDQFNSGIRRALGAFRGFAASIGDGVGSAMAAFGNLQSTMFFLMNNLRALGDLARAVFDEFIGGAIEVERQQAAFTALTGSGEQAAEMMEFLQDMATRTGVSFEGLLPSAQQAAVGLRSINGEVDLDQWAQMVELVTRFQTLRPDVPVSLWGRAISSFMAGDPSTLTRLLDVNVRDIQGLTEEAQNFLEAGAGATEQQLGKVTRLGEGAQQEAGNALAFLEEVAQAVGATEELVEGQADTTAGRMNILTERFEELKREVGEELLPIFNELLELIIKIFDEHGDDIERFIDKFGEFSAEQWVELSEALQNVDWDKVAETVSKIVDLLTGAQKLFPNSPFVANVAEAGGPAGAGQQAGEDVRNWLSNVSGGLLFPNAGEGGNNGGGGGGAGAGGGNGQTVEVNINLRNEMLEAEIDRRSSAQAVAAVDEMVAAAQAEGRTTTRGGR